MADGTVLRLKFDDNAGQTVTYNVKYAKSTLTGAQAGALASTMIANTAIYPRTLVTATSAELITTSSTPLVMS